MISLLRRLFPAGLRGQVAGILLLGLLLSQAMAAALYMSLLPHWQKVSRPELAVTKVAMVVRLLESVPEAQRADFAGALERCRISRRVCRCRGCGAAWLTVARSSSETGRPPGS